jgi:elongation factor P
MATISASDFRRGLTVVYNGQPHQMTEVQFVNPGKGSSFYRTTLKNLRTGRVVDVTFKQNESLEDYPVFTHEMQYLYNDGTEYNFMNQETHDPVSATADVLGTPAQFLVEGDVYQIVMHESEVLGIRPPKRVVLTVDTAEDVARGSTVSGVLKQVTTDNGATVAVPAFIKQGDRIAVNPENGEYIERVT